MSTLSTTVRCHPEYMADSLHEYARLLLLGITEFQSHRLTGKSDLAIGSSSKADIRVNVAVDYIRDGIQRSQIATAEVNVPSGATMADDGTARSVMVLVYVNTSDALTALAGTIATDGAEPVVPDLPTGCVQIGYAKIAAAAGTAYTADSTLLDAAGITATFYDKPVPEQNWSLPYRLGNL